MKMDIVKSILRILVLIMSCVVLCKISVIICRADEKIIMQTEENVTESTEKQIEVTDIELASYEEELKVDKTMILSTTVIPSEAADIKVKFSSSNTEIATVSSTGEVKGIAPGKVTIYITAGNFTKEVVLTVKIATTRIYLDSNYVVLKCGESYQLQGNAQPAGAEQTLFYKAVNTDIVYVSESGKMTAKSEGNTTVIVSNGDMSNAVTVIVNAESIAESDNQENNSESEENYIAESEQKLLELLDKQEVITIKAEEYEKISTAVLKKLYASGKVFNIQGENYTMKLSGEDIVNYENELYTVLEQTQLERGVEFTVNRGNNLPGKIAVVFDEDNNYQYVYLYNISKNRYQQLNQSGFSEIILDTTGTYLLSKSKISNISIRVIFIVLAILVVAVLAAVYVIVKKRYWFW